MLDKQGVVGLEILAMWAVGVENERRDVDLFVLSGNAYVLWWKPTSSGFAFGIEAMDLFVFFLLFFTVSLLGYYSAWLDESGTGVVTNLCMWVVLVR